MSQKEKFHLKWNVTKNEMSLKLKCHQNFPGLFSTFSEYSEFGTDCCGLVFKTAVA